MANKIVQLVEYLRDPKLVFRFQSFCGVRLEYEKDKSDSKTENLSYDSSELDMLSSPEASRPPTPTDNGANEKTYPPPGTVIRTNPLINLYFGFATELGYEIFYILFLPILHFNFDSTVLRQMVMLWAITMYLGQVIKNLVQWERPRQPAIPLEKNPSLYKEYGFPSTHACVSVTMPFYILFATYTRYNYPFVTGLVCSLIWMLSVSLSRVYLGVHSFMDILGGAGLSVLMLLICVPFLGQVDLLLVHFPYTPLLLLSLATLLLYIYPLKPGSWSMDRGDTAAILGVAVGVMSGASTFGETPDDLLVPPIAFHWPTLMGLWVALIRYVIGILLIVSNRFLMKLLCFRLLPLIMPSGGVEDVGKNPWVELPYKIITYTSVGFHCYVTTIHVFRYFGISRY